MLLIKKYNQQNKNSRLTIIRLQIKRSLKNYTNLYLVYKLNTHFIIIYKPKHL